MELKKQMLESLKVNEFKVGDEIFNVQHNYNMKVVRVLPTKLEITSYYKNPVTGKSEENTKTTPFTKVEKYLKSGQWKIK